MIYRIYRGKLYRIVHDLNYLQQCFAAARWHRQEHDRLIAEGWTWDGQDGYSLEISQRSE